MSARWQLTAVTLCMILAAPFALHADIYRWDNGQLIPGTEGITPGPGVQLDHMELEYAELSRRRPHRGEFRLSNLTSAMFENSGLTNADLSGANLTSAFLYGSTLTSANLSGANLAFAHLAATLTSANLSGAVVTGTSFDGTTPVASPGPAPSTASYQMNNLQGIGLGNNDLTGWDFSGQNLTVRVLPGRNAYPGQPERGGGDRNEFRALTQDSPWPNSNRRPATRRRTCGHRTRRQRPDRLGLQRAEPHRTQGSASASTASASAPI